MEHPGERPGAQDKTRPAEGVLVLKFWWILTWPPGWGHICVPATFLHMGLDSTSVQHAKAVIPEGPTKSQLCPALPVNQSA